MFMYGQQPFQDILNPVRRRRSIPACLVLRIPIPPSPIPAQLYLRQMKAIGKIPWAPRQFPWASL
jgi:hypothetical protein